VLCLEEEPEEGEEYELEENNRGADEQGAEFGKKETDISVTQNELRSSFPLQDDAGPESSH
jgi:hypothetical protein